MIVRGTAWKYGDNIDTDAIIPARYLNRSTEEELAAHCMEDVDPLFASRVRSGDIVVGGDNFGCGSSREHAVLALKGCGVACVVARSFARIFYRNAINSGLPILECSEAVDATEAGDGLSVDLSLGTISNETKACECTASPFPEVIMGIIEAGGLIPFTRERLKGRKEAGAVSDARLVGDAGGQE